MSALIIDYTRNASSLEEFVYRYPEFYKIIRNKYPNIPVILLGGCGVSVRFDEFVHDFCRNQIKIYPNTFYVSQREIIDTEKECFISMDSVHYSDMGMVYIAKKIINVLSIYY